MQTKKIRFSGCAENDLPREKMRRQGPEYLSDHELLAILLRSGTVHENVLELSQHILDDCDGSLVNLSHKRFDDFMRYDGIGEAKALAVMAALELGKRRRASEVMEQKIIRNSRDAYEYIQDRLTDLDHEEFWLVLLKNNHEIMEKWRVSTGGSDSTVVDGKIVFRHLILRNAVAFIVCHNHPSDHLLPSLQDRRLTKNLSQSADLLGIRLLDHLIVGSQSYFSFKDEGIL